MKIQPSIQSRSGNAKMTTRRSLLALGVALLSSPALVMASSPIEAAAPLVRVWKDPYCGCCNDWIVHLEQHGFRVEAFDLGNRTMRSRLGMPEALGSCHTAVVQGYVIEGHVPAADIQRLLKDRPEALGLSVPGMPIGSPGMDAPIFGEEHEAYDVLLVKRDGTTEVWAHYPAKTVRQG